MELVSLKSFFLHRVKSWARIVFLGADHFHRLHLNQGRYGLILLKFISISPAITDSAKFTETAAEYLASFG
jgi:hypothetical protein